MQQDERRGLQKIHPGWHATLGQEFDKPYMHDLRKFLQSEIAAGHAIFPPKDAVFRALELVPPGQLQVVIVGQDPYHGLGQANGLSFAVNPGVPTPPSLKNIFKELSSDLQVPAPTDTSLLGWARQGVLLLNSVLTVRAHTAFSHRDKGWERFTAKVIEIVNAECPHLVFILWGSSAQRHAEKIDRHKHHVIRSPHPSPLSAHRGFFGSRPFSQANQWLHEQGREGIQWDLTGTTTEKTFSTSQIEL